MYTIFTNFVPIKVDLSGNTGWPQTLDSKKKNSQTDHFWYFPSIFVLWKIELSGNTVRPFKLAKINHFGIFINFLSCSIARFARNVEKWDFLCGFQTLCRGHKSSMKYQLEHLSIIFPCLNYGGKIQKSTFFPFFSDSIEARFTIYGYFWCRIDPLHCRNNVIRKNHSR